MKTKIIFILILLIGNFGIGYSQSLLENLEKYWFYRERLKTDFIYFTNDVSIKGSHQPIENRANYSEGSGYIRLGDATLNLGYYIGILAMEYKLLKDNGQDYWSTELELIHALLAYDRLDNTAETCFENSLPQWNGFFLRDDMGGNTQEINDILNYFEVTTIHSGYLSSCNINDRNVISQDQVIGLFFGLAMVKHCVDDQWFQTKAEEIANALIEEMHKWDFCPIILLPMEVWEIENPVTGQIVPIGGSFWDLFSLCWAHATAAGFITGDNEHQSYSNYPPTKDIWDLAQNSIVNMINGESFTFTIYILGFEVGSYTIELPEYNAEMIAWLSTLANEWGGGESNLYEWLVQFNEDTKGMFGMPDNIGVFPFLPLIAKLLYGYNGQFEIPATYYETNFFNPAPACGAKHYVYGDIHDVTDPPWHTLSLFYPWHNEPGWLEDGDYPMLDYMLMYNAYFCDYYDDPKPYLLIKESYPQNIENTRKSAIKKSPPQSNAETVSRIDPVTITAPRRIDAINSLYSGANVNYVAGSEIHLLPGFHSYSNSNFNASIDPSLSIYDIYYNKTFVDPCNQSISWNSILSKDLITKLIDEYKELNMNETEKLTIGNDTKNINKFLQIVNTTKDSSFLVFPNPSSGRFFIDLSVIDEVVKIEILSTSGINISNCILINSNQCIVDLSSAKAGVYYLRIIQNHSVNIIKLIKI